MKNVTRFSKLIIVFLLSVFSFYQAKGDGVITIGTANYWLSNLPCYPYFGYSWSQCVYLQSEMGMSTAIQITQIAYHEYSYYSPYTMTDEQIYMKNVPYSTVTNTSYPDPANNGYTHVYSGSVTWPGPYLDSWVVFTLQTPFIWDGSSNISIVYEDHDIGWTSSYPYFYGSYIYPNNSSYAYNDNYWPSSGYTYSYRADIQLYWQDMPPGILNGTVTDAYSGLPIIGAKVTAGTDYAYTAADGTYSMELLAVTYNVIFEKAGYTTQSQYVYVSPNTTTTLNAALVEEAVPPSGVLAALRPPNNNVVDVTWGIPNGYYEIIYDDGTFENMTAWLEEGSLNALKFTPVGYPVNVTGGSVNIGDGTFPPGGDQLQTFGIAVFDDDGPNGYPGTYLGSIEVEPQAFGWVSFDLSSLGITFSSGEFYIGMQQGGNWP
ncbi:MAG: carboxypeptidase-like regulatory domain-containing protein, partial [Bacteroidetes bacterium]|nr:carboxypeptidase-like regulatory domain-containing protein [Bacteroidota bacterium]